MLEGTLVVLDSNEDLEVENIFRTNGVSTAGILALDVETDETLLEDNGKLESNGGFAGDDVFNSFSKIEIKFLSSTNPTRHSLQLQFFVDPPFLLRIATSS